MRFIRATAFQIKRIIKTPALIGSLFFLPMAFTFLFLFGTGEDSLDNVGKSVMVIEEGNEELTALFLEQLGGEDTAKRLIAEEADLDLALRDLDAGKLQLVYYLPENLLQNRAEGGDRMVEVYSMTGDQADPVINMALEKAYRDLVRQEEWEKMGVGPDQIELPRTNQLVELEMGESHLDQKLGSFVGALSGLLMMYAPGLAGEYIQFRKNQVLKRMSVSPNRSLVTLGSLLLGYGLFLILVASGALAIISLLGITSPVMLPRFVIYYSCCVIFALSFSLFLFRIFKDERVVAGLGMFIGILLLALAIAPSMFNDSELIGILGRFSPLYWMFEGMETGALVPGVPAILLMSAVLFTAGSYKLEDFALS